MNVRKYTISAFIITLAGTIFSGYLSGTKFFKGTCALGESCPYFLDMPACYYGFVLFALMFLATTIALIQGGNKIWLKNFNTTFSLIGLIFSGNFVVRDIANWIEIGYLPDYAMILPTCFYGFIFYAIILFLSTKVRNIISTE